MKRKLIVLGLLTLLLTALFVLGASGASASEYKMGDVNMDGAVNTRDVVLVKQSIVGMTELTDEQKAYADVYDDGTNTINTRDVVLILQYIVGVVEELGHSYDNGIVTTEPTCTEKGVKTFTCEVCGDTYTEEVDELEHDEQNHDAKAPTCLDIGWDAYVTCSRCDYTTYAEKSALGHDEQNHSAKAPTCLGIGWDAYVTCSRCDYTTYAEKAALGHDYNTVVTAPSCIDDGYTTYTCHCGDSYVANEITALGHSYNNGVITTEPTCTEKGVKTFTCGTCCDAYTEEVDATEHTHNAVVTSPTCTAKGYTTYTCHCGDSYVMNEVGALGHTEVTDTAVPATCTATGLTEGKHCSVCDVVLVVQEAIAIIDHIESDWIIDAEATITEDGAMHTTCTMCGKKLNEKTIDATGTIGLRYSKYTYTAYDSYSVSIGSCKEINIVIPSKHNGFPVVEIGYFWECDEIKTVEISDGIIWIGEEAFYSCDSLTSVTIPNSVKSIDDRAFQYCHSLSNITIPASVSRIGTASFYNCPLTSITIPSSVRSIGRMAFSYCTSLEYVDVSAEITEIDKYVFQNCGSLKIIHLPKTVAKICSSAFEGCASLTDIYYTGTTQEWNKIVKDSYWDFDTGYYTVHCSDGKIAKDGTFECNTHSYGDWYEVSASTCTANGTNKRDCSKCDHTETISIPAMGHLYENSVCIYCNAAQPVVLYRYREKYYEESTTWLDSPWIYCGSDIIGYEHNVFETEYIFLSSSSHDAGIDVDKLDKEMKEKYCIHKVGYIYYYKNRSGNWVYGTSMQMSQYADSTWILSGSPGLVLYREYTYCTRKTPTYLYCFYSYGEWSEWSETPITESDTIEVETKEVSRDDAET